MNFGFLNVAMLAGLAAMALPVLAHLISRRKFDIVQWGAMQFLQLGRKTRRRIRLEEWLLMLLRMGVLGLIAFGMSRPWAAGGAISSLTGRVSRDVVLVLDGSYSMGWKGPVDTPTRGRFSGGTSASTRSGPVTRSASWMSATKSDP